MVGGRDYNDDALQPRDQGPAPARLLVQGLRPRGRAARTASRRTRSWTSKQKEFVVPNTHGTGKIRRPQRRRRLLRLEHADRRDRLLGQLDLRRSRAQSRHPQDRAAGAPDGHHHAAVDQPGDDDRRAHSRRHAARHGPRLRDDRPRRPARQRHAGLRRRDRSAIQEVDAGAHTLPDGNHHDVNHVKTKAVLPASDRRDRDLDARDGAAVRHRQGRRDRPVRRRQDRHDLQLRRRLVRRLGQQVHGRRVGRLPRQAGPDDHRLQRRARARRHLPGADLARLHDLRADDRQGRAPKKPPPARSRSRRNGRRRIYDRHRSARVAQRRHRAARPAAANRAKAAARHALRAAAAEAAPAAKRHRPGPHARKTPAPAAPEATPTPSDAAAVGVPPPSPTGGVSPTASCGVSAPRPARAALYGRGRETLRVAARAEAPAAARPHG